MKTRLGIAGVPSDVDAVERIGAVLGVSLVYLLETGAAIDALPTDAEIYFGGFEDIADWKDDLKSLALSGLWVAEDTYRKSMDLVASYFHWPHLPCPEPAPDGCCLVPEAKVYTVDALSTLAGHGGEGMPVPAWVRASCGDGDMSCMRVEHPGDLSLALEKLRKRSPDGVLRVQPSIVGTIYRLMAFKTGYEIIPFDLMGETVTSSVYRVPLGLTMPVPRRGALFDECIAQAHGVNKALPPGWGYLELEFVVADGAIHLTDIQAPARLREDVRVVACLSQGVDLLRAAMECALGRRPSLTPTRETGAALSWMLTRSGIVNGIEGAEVARNCPGVVDVHLNAKEGDILSHVVDLPSRERGGYIVTKGPTGEVAKERLDTAREQIRINTSIALS